MCIRVCVYVCVCHHRWAHEKMVAELKEKGIDYETEKLKKRAARLKAKVKHTARACGGTQGHSALKCTFTSLR